MTDKELLEYAAKAAGIEVPAEGPWGGIDQRGIWRDTSCGGDGTRFWTWNPLQDDGDALRLAVKLHLCVTAVDCGCMVTSGWVRTTSGIGDGLDVYGATRRAIVRAAAEIGKAMP